MMRSLAGRTVLLTGASSGLGPVIARRLRREGARFVLSGRDRERLAALAEELGESTVVTADLAHRGEARFLARFIEFLPPYTPSLQRRCKGQPP